MRILLLSEFRPRNSGLPPMEFLISTGGNQDFRPRRLTTKLMV